MKGNHATPNNRKALYQYIPDMFPCGCRACYHVTTRAGKQRAIFPRTNTLTLTDGRMVCRCGKAYKLHVTAVWKEAKMGSLVRG